LSIAGRPVPHSTERCKRDFRDHFGDDAHEASVFERHFGQAVLDAARGRVNVLNILIDYLQKPPA
jgi:hypothetical protein